MPYKLRKPCRYPGCVELTHDTYCEAHKKQVNRQYEKYKRDPETANKYNGEWRRIRESYIATYPLCEKCKQEGRLVPAEHVHHVIELKDGGSNEFDNLLSLCKSHHSTIHYKKRFKPLAE